MSNDHRIGTRIGDYVIHGVVGRGGMGVVYRATRPADGTTVALKLMLPELAANQEFRDRFLEEAEASPTIDHPNVVPVYEYGERDGELYIAMLLVEGYDLKKLIARKGRLEPRSAMKILTQVASALDAAHESGIVHRDVKPQNILIAPSDEAGDHDHVYITDFGLIRPVGHESTSSRTGEIFGSIPYISPEQIEGLPDDGRGDVYSLACVAFECLTGAIPFDRPNEVGVIWAHVHEDPPRATDVVASLPGGVDDVIRRGMAKHPDERPLTCGELVAELTEGLKRQKRAAFVAPLRPLVRRVKRPKTEREVWGPNFFPELSRVRRASHRIRWGRGIALTAAFFVAAAGALQAAHPQGLSGSVRDVASALDEVVEDAGGITEDARVQDREARRADPARPARGGHGAPPTDESTGESSVAAGPKGGGTDNRRPLGPAPERAAAVPKENTILFHVTDRSWNGYSAIYTMREDGSHVRLLYNSSQPDYDAAWSPDGSAVAFIHDDDLYVVAADGTGLRQLTPGPGRVRDPAWSPNGAALVYSYNALPGSSDWDIYARNLADDATDLGEQWTSSAAVDTDPHWIGSKVVFTREDASGRRRVHIMEVGGSSVQPLGAAGAETFHPALSPDGGRVAYVVADHAGQRIEVRSLGTGATTVVPCVAQCTAPAWSPDGERLLLVDGAESEPTFNLYITSVKDPSARVEVATKVSADTKGDWR